MTNFRPVSAARRSAQSKRHFFWRSFPWLLFNIALTMSATPPNIDFQPQNQTVILYQQAAFGMIASGSVERQLFFPTDDN